MDALGASRNGGQHDLGRRYGEVLAVVLADTDEVHAKLIGQHRLVNEVADDLRVQKRLSVSAGGNVAESIQAEFGRLCHAKRHNYVSSPSETSGAFGIAKGRRAPVGTL